MSGERCNICGRFVRTFGPGVSWCQTYTHLDLNDPIYRCSPCTDKSDKTEYVLASTHQRTLEALREAREALLADTLTTSGLTQDEIDYFIRKLVQ